ncbi:winged helix-turn-helix domain-containing protein [Spirosoma jeollabukense]
MKKSVIIIALLVAGLLFMQFAWRTPSAGQGNKADFAKKVNLALRRTAHHLLIEKGDSTSRIPVVQHSTATTFLVRLEQPFDYGRLPTLLQQSLAIHQIKANYDVALVDCATGELQLGYNFLDVSGKNEIPCGGRQQKRGCYTLQLTFNTPVSPQPKATSILWAWAVGFLLVGGAYIVWQKSDKKTNSVLPPETIPRASDHLISVGQLSFNTTNQSVNVAGTMHPLTYREAKLLHLFVRHPNQLLTRDFILKSVWEDEGIIVGRSADVFVSRLRKLLQPDSTIRIVAVHGVGYRLEVIT